jgi:predicted NUDIX family phosphoesterase
MMEDRFRGERVLVFPRATLDALGAFQGIRADWQRYLEVILDKKTNHFVERYRAEADESLKQIIPYVLFKSGDAVFSYVRGKAAGEKRLVGNRSIGIGGHINPVDEQLLFASASVSASSSSDMASYLEAVRREIAEEVIVDGPFDPAIAAVLNDDSNPVGRVHFCVVHVCEVSPAAVHKREQQITDAGFLPIADLCGLRREELETWSTIAIDFLAGR